MESAGMRRNYGIIHCAGNSARILWSFSPCLPGIYLYPPEKGRRYWPNSSTADRQKHVPVPPIFGGVALAAGAVLLVMGARQKPLQSKSLKFVKS